VIACRNLCKYIESIGVRINIYVTVSVKTCIVCTISDFFSQHYLQCLRGRYSKFQLNQASSCSTRQQ